MNLPKLIVIGYGRHGKDTFCEIARDLYNFNFISSSSFCAENLIYPELKEKYGYETIEDCYNDRHNHRSEWFDLIAKYNETDNSALGREILSKHDIYCGLRRKEELESILLKDICDYVIWIDASDRLPPEDESSCTVTPDMADITIYNNDTYENFLKISSYIIENYILTRALIKNDRYRSKI
jgi:hypothetical protein